MRRLAMTLLPFFAACMPDQAVVQPMGGRVADTTTDDGSPAAAAKTPAADAAAKTPAATPVPATTISKAYAVSATADYYVNAATGDDNNIGSREKPFKTIREAVEHAGPGDVVRIGRGTYHETVSLTRAGTATSPITFEGEDPANTIITAADPLTGWTRLSNGTYSHVWTYVFLDTKGKNTSGSGAPLGYMEQVIANGQMLTRAIDGAALKAGEFTIDYANKKLSVRLKNDADANTVAMSATTRQTLWGRSKPEITHIRVRGLTMTYAANSYQQGALTTSADWSVEDVTVFGVNTRCVSLYGDRAKLLRVRAIDCGFTGISGSGGDNMIVQDSEISRGNLKGFYDGDEASGGKFSSTTGLQVIRLWAHGSNGNGFWLDINNRDYLITGGIFENNTRGLMIEISYGGVVEKNTFRNNSSTGVLVAESKNVIVRNNDISGSDYTISLRDMTNREFGRLTDTVITGNRISKWKVRAVAPFTDVSVQTLDENTYTKSAPSDEISLTQSHSLKTLKDLQSYGVELHGKVID